MQNMQRLTNYQNKYFCTLNDFFQCKVIAFQISLCLGVSPGFQKIRQAHDHIIYCCSLTSDDQFLATGSRDKILKIWNIETKNCLQNLKAFTKNHLLHIF